MICKKNRRKVRVTFADEIEEEKPLASVIDIESYKKYNYIFGMPKVDTINKNITTNCQCCNVFWHINICDLIFKFSKSTFVRINDIFYGCFFTNFIY